MARLPSCHSFFPPFTPLWVAPAASSEQRAEGLSWFATTHTRCMTISRGPGDVTLLSLEQKRNKCSITALRRRTFWELISSPTVSPHRLERLPAAATRWPASCLVFQRKDHGLWDPAASMPDNGFIRYTRRTTSTYSPT